MSSHLMTWGIVPSNTVWGTAQCGSSEMDCTAGKLDENVMGLTACMLLMCCIETAYRISFVSVQGKSTELPALKQVAFANFGFVRITLEN